LDVQDIKKWKKAEKVKNRRETEKRKIREAFSNTAAVEVIPAKTEEMKGKVRRTRVAAYCRVSTYEDAQVGSFELQVQYFKETIEKNPNYEFTIHLSFQEKNGIIYKNKIWKA
jgi:hypothetical protein